MQNDRQKTLVEQDQYPLHLFPGMMAALIPREISRAARSGGDLTILMLALNGLELVRSRYGAAESERFVVEAAHLLQTVFRGCDALARYGEDHFILALPDTNLHQAERAVVRVLDAIDHWNGTPKLSYNMSVTCGMAPYVKGATLEDVIRFATRQLNQNKAAAAHNSGNLTRAAGAGA
ncbi:MAG TPA: diguanylate cyclase [Terriglobales bacterium]|nr:diguanylate cyclase [Terriglobales bacterium]